MIEVLEGGIQTTVQDFPGRQGLLDQGIVRLDHSTIWHSGWQTCWLGTIPGRPAGDHRREFQGHDSMRTR